MQVTLEVSEQISDSPEQNRGDGATFMISEQIG